MNFKIKIDKEALQDIQEITDWYNNQVVGLGSRFQRQIKSQINSLKINPFINKIRYESIHCLLVKNFLFLYIIV